MIKNIAAEPSLVHFPDSMDYYFSFLIIVNMYIAVILENYSQATEDVQEGNQYIYIDDAVAFLYKYLPGITDEDYDLFYEIWQEFDPDGTQYIDYKALSEFLDVLEQPLQVLSASHWSVSFFFLTTFDL